MLNLLVLVCFIAFALRRLLTYLHIFQQEEYDAKRFVSWLIEYKAFDKRLSALLLGGVIVSFIYAPVGLLALAAAFIYVAVVENDPLKAAKKPLVLTQRAKRIGGVAAAFIGLVTLVLFLATSAFTPLWILYVQFIPFSLALAVYAMAPIDKHVNEKFRAEAVKKLEEINPYTIAITGSFGKTSVKHILGHVLENFAPTLITPGSVNTEMGITRVLREQLTPNHKYLISEMGAYAIGSIARLCRLTPPNLSVLTAVGNAHYERFKSLEETARAKFEIAEAAIAKGGKTILHSSVMERKYAKEFVPKHPESFVIVGPGEDFAARDVKQTSDGIEFTFTLEGKDHTVQTPLYGLHHVENVLIAVTVALEIGMKVEDIILSLKTVPQIKHRLEVKRLDAYTVIDDAFNSNPIGFEAALNILDIINDKGGKRILVTPGMVELGEEHDMQHEKIAKIAAEKTDVVLLVRPERIESFAKTYEQQDTKGELIRVPSFHKAQEWLTLNAAANDVVLLENDLPDLYETKLKI